mmetsp:Transcript_35619/g.111961  ORF Transcript_35619/g.111961 Transcript_35619/m.111961 type:complete len:220 (+) Transcript_35619:165-824(+)
MRLRWRPWPGHYCLGLTMILTVDVGAGMGGAGIGGAIGVGGAGIGGAGIVGAVIVVSLRRSICNDLLEHFPVVQEILQHGFQVRQDEHDGVPERVDDVADEVDLQLRLAHLRLEPLHVRRHCVPLLYALIGLLLILLHDEACPIHGHIALGEHRGDVRGVQHGAEHELHVRRVRRGEGVKRALARELADDLEVLLHIRSQDRLHKVLAQALLPLLVPVL